MSEVIVRADEAERKLLEGAMYAPREAARILALVTQEDFTDPGMRLVFRMARDLLSSRKPVNQHTVKRLLKDLGWLRQVDKSIFTEESPASVAEAEAAAAALVARRRAAETPVPACPESSRGAPAAADVAPASGEPTPVPAVADVAQAPPPVNVAQSPPAAKKKERPHPRAGVPHHRDDDVTLRDFAAVEASLAEVSWLWEGWLPRGLVTVLAASPGEGKSGLALEIARRAMGGAATWPDGAAVSCGLCGTGALACDGKETAPAEGGWATSEGKTAPAGGGWATSEGKTVVLVDTEAAEAILRRRVRDWAIPKDRLRVFATEGPTPGLARLALDDPRDWARIVSAVMETRPALVVVDSLSGGHALDENRAQIRHLLLKLAHLARDSRSAMLVVHHLRKRAGGDSSGITLDRLRGSGTLAQLARCVWAVDRPDPGDVRRRLFQVKNNLAPCPAPIGFTIGAAGLSFTDAPVKPCEPSQLELAEEFLRSLLSGGPILAIQVYRDAEDQGFARTTLNRAAARVGVVRTRDSKLGRFCWSLPKT